MSIPIEKFQNRSKKNEIFNFYQTKYTIFVCKTCVEMKTNWLSIK